MPFTLDQLTELPVIVLTPSESGMFQESHEMTTHVVSVFNTLSEPAFLIVDMRHIRLSLDDVTKKANQAARERPDVLNHPNMRELLVVSQDNLIKLAIQGMSSPIFGNLRFKAFDTPEMALDYCREQIAESASDQARNASG
jgi:hypothetical protein